MLRGTLAERAAACPPGACTVHDEHPDTTRMPENPSRPAATPEPDASARERRSNRRLRELIDEMLASVRIAVNRDLWTPDERAATEADLARMMDAVRSEAVAPRPAADGAQKRAPRGPTK
jgi:hypothetical protein